MSEIKIEHGEFDPEKPTYKSLTDDEVNQLAKRLYRNEIFPSWWIREHDAHLITSIFMPLVFVDEITRKQWVADGIAHFYGEYGNGPNMGVNGYPIFFSFGILNNEDAKRVNDKYNEIRNLLGDI